MIAPVQGSIREYRHALYRQTRLTMSRDESSSNFRRNYSISWLVLWIIFHVNVARHGGYRVVSVDGDIYNQMLELDRCQKSDSKTAKKGGNSDTNKAF